MIDGTYAACLANGNTLVKQLNKYLVLLESELCHELLPAPLQSVALSGLVTITGLDLSGWHKMQQEILIMIEPDNCEHFDTIKDHIAEWKEYFIKMLKFIEIIPDESLRFYNDGVEEDVRPLCEWGNDLINELIKWMQSFQDIDNVAPETQGATDAKANESKISTNRLEEE